jgi:hypothetical protein
MTYKFSLNTSEPHGQATQKFSHAVYSDPELRGYPQSTDRTLAISYSDFLPDNEIGTNGMHNRNHTKAKVR